MRGASAIEELLKELPADKLRVFVVWEPILPSDWQRPTGPVLALLSDLRVSQYWDKDHLIAKLVRDHLSPDEPDCCTHNGILWDMVALYPKHSTLNVKPAFVAGPVRHVTDRTRKRLGEM